MNKEDIVNLLNKYYVNNIPFPSSVAIKLIEEYCIFKGKNISLLSLFINAIAQFGLISRLTSCVIEKFIEEYSICSIRKDNKILLFY